MVYQLIIGRVPYSGQSTVDVLLQHLQQPIPLEPLRGLNPAAAQAFGPILQRALAKDPNHRYQTGRELMQAVNVAIAQTGFDRWASAPTVVAGTPPPGLAGTPPGLPGTPPPFPMGGGSPPPYSVAYTPPPGAVAATANTDSRRMLLIVGIVIGSVVVICCCLLLLASLSNN
jgi:serine/threonine-protein kinase